MICLYCLYYHTKQVVIASRCTLIPSICCWHVSVFHVNHGTKEFTEYYCVQAVFNNYCFHKSVRAFGTFWGVQLTHCIIYIPYENTDVGMFLVCICITGSVCVWIETSLLKTPGCHFGSVVLCSVGVSSWDHSTADGWSKSHKDTPAAGAQPSSQNSQRLHSW